MHFQPGGFFFGLDRTDWFFCFSGSESESESESHLTMMEAFWIPLLLLFAACSASPIEMSGFVPRAAVPAFNASLRGGFSGLHVAANPAQFKELSPTCKVPLKAPAETSTLDDDLLCNKQVELSSFLSRIAMPFSQ